jgi:hypothetical protein
MQYKKRPENCIKFPEYSERLMGACPGYLEAFNKWRKHHTTIVPWNGYNPGKKTIIEE